VAGEKRPSLTYAVLLAAQCTKEVHSFAFASHPILGLIVFAERFVFHTLARNDCFWNGVTLRSVAMEYWGSGLA
jgi:hypothetical protein